MSDIESTFSGLGGKFLSTPAEIAKKYARIKAIIFDWDGVFNDGYKYGETGSLFSESDSMGVNLLRFNYFLIHNRYIKTFIITGLHNKSAVSYVEREHFDGIFLNYKNKEVAIDIITGEYGIARNEVAFIFDDVLDLGIARTAALSFFVKRKASPLTTEFVLNNKLCDYVTGMEGGDFAVREVCELLMGVSGRFNETLEKRIQFTGSYAGFYEARQHVTTRVFTFN
jgi:3-deoxy-D-manno-octulosonate 8-phosphate phosphatase (KDO 8-P phosphatase)